MARTARVKTTDQVPDSVLEGALIDAVQTMQKPVTAAVLSKNMVGPFKRSAAVFETILGRLAAEGRLILLSPVAAKKKPAYSTRPLDELTRLAILECLTGSAVALPLTKLKSQPALKSLGDYTSALNLSKTLDELVRERKVFVHPKCTAAGKIQARPGDVSFGVSPPKPDLFLDLVLKTIRKQIDPLAKTLEPFGVDPATIYSGLVALLQREYGVTGHQSPDRPKPGRAAGEQEHPPQPDLSTLAQQIYDRMAELNPAVRTGAMVRLDRLRTRCWDLAETKEQFDDAVRWLAATHRVALHRHDDPHGLTPEERAALVPDDHDGLYNAASWRI